MSTIITTVNHWAEAWLGIMIAVAWQSALLVAAATLIAWLLRRASPVVRYWLWQIVAVKLLLMPFWTLAVPLPAWTETKPVAESAAVRPSEGSGADQFRLMPRNVSSLPDGPGGKSSLQAPQFWDIFSAVTWRAWLLLAWMAVLLWQCVRLFMQHLQLTKLLNQGVPASAGLIGLVAELAGQIGLSRVPAAVCVAGDCPLFVCGLWRPRLVLPGRLLDSLEPAERRQVVLHELGHIKRHDLFWGWPIEIARIVYFFNPLVYWAAYQIRLERELACDQLAMAQSGHPPAEYAQTLVQVVSHSSEPASVQAAAIAAGLTGSEPKVRMKDEG
jgi:beta-lactamase regulating signal transducer with metallopeptidase domain